MKIRRIATQALTGLMAGVLLFPGTAASANTYTVTWTWEVPHVSVASPAEFTIAVGDVIITHQDLDSDRLLGMVGVLAVTAEVSVTAPPPVGYRATCAAGDGVVFTLPDVAGSTYVEASFVREGTLEVLAGPHRTETGSGGPTTFEVCGPGAAESLADVLGGPPTDQPDPDPEPEPDDDPGTVCGVPPRHDNAEDRGSPCPRARDDSASGDRRDAGDRSVVAVRDERGDVRGPRRGHATEERAWHLAAAATAPDSEIAAMLEDVARGPLS